MKSIFLSILLAIVLLTSPKTANLDAYKDFKSIISPLNDISVINGSFAELRVNHFHTGLDFRCPIGTPVYSVEDGYVYRVGYSKYGYGRCLYIMHKNGLVTVFGHLDEFSGKIMDRLYQEQANRYDVSVDFYLKPNEIPVKKGEIIAYSGNTGFSGGPHLHFEVRSDSASVALNPAYFLKVEDNCNPIIENTSVYALDNQGILQNNQSTIINPKEITAFGKIYLGAECYDIANFRPEGRNAPYKVSFIVNDDTICKMVFNKIPFSISKQVNSMTDYKTRQQTGKRFMISYKHPNNQLDIYSVLKNDGIIDIKDNCVYNIKVSTEDFSGNQTCKQFRIIGKYSPIPMNNVDNYIKCDRNNYIFKDSSGVILPKGSIYFDMPLFVDEVKDSLNPYSNRLIVQNQDYALNLPIMIGIKLKKNVNCPKNKLVLVQQNQKKSVKSIKGTVKNNVIWAETSSFGQFYVALDTVAPIIRQPKLTFARYNSERVNKIEVFAFDNLSGISDYQFYLDNNRMIVDANWSNGCFSCITKILPGSHKFYCTFTDERGNKNELNWDFTL